MKKYVSAILIDILLFQFCGCYSFNEMTLNEVNNEEEEIKFVTKDSSNYYLKKEVTSREVIDNPDIRFSDDWLINPELGIINVIYKRAYRDSNEANISYIRTDTSNVNFSEVKEISARRSEGVKFAIVLAVTLGVVLFIYITTELISGVNEDLTNDGSN